MQSDRLLVGLLRFPEDLTGGANQGRDHLAPEVAVKVQCFIFNVRFGSTVRTQGSKHVVEVARRERTTMYQRVNIDPLIKRHRSHGETGKVG